MSLEFYLFHRNYQEHTIAVEELLTEITHRLIACEQSIRRLSKQIDEQTQQGGVK